jgi:biopolymer transport protein ExbD/biopolymer transport protein TolR
MSFRRRNLEPPRVDLTPMIDVVFLLLIFFMISTTFIERPGLKIDLPDSSTFEALQTEKEVQIYLGKDGEIYFQQQQMSLAALVQQLNSYGPAAVKMTFILMADTDALHGRVIQLMDAAKTAGFGKLAIATDKKVAH